MTNSITANGLAIHFISDMSNETHYIYEVQLENVGCDGVDYDMKNLYCSNGNNVLDLNEFDLSLLNDKTLLNDGHIVVGVDRVLGVIAFEKEITITNDAPIFEYVEWVTNSYSAQIGGI